MPEFGDLMTLKKPREHLVALFGDRPLDFKPGEALVYNNSAYQGGNTFDVNQTLAIFERGGWPRDAAAPRHGRPPLSAEAQADGVELRSNAVTPA